MATNDLSDYTLSTQTLQQLAQQLKNEMDLGLHGKREKSSLKMLTSFVHKPNGNETGVYYALDLGGTNFRVLRLELKGNGEVGTAEKQQFTIHKEAMTGSAENLFDFIAECVQSFAQKDGALKQKGKLGFTFSFPVNQTGIASGTLIRWTKGFSTEGVEGQDVVKLLSHSFAKKGLDIEVSALVNDTVGTMVARCYQDSKCEMGVILGTGTNACYAEKVSNIKTFQGTFPSDQMIINMEWGAFGDVNDVLPRTKADRQIDESSINPNQQRFEKMISGMYLGEILRLAVVDLIQQKKLFAGLDSSNAIFQRDAVHTSLLSRTVADTSTNLDDVETMLKEKFGINSSFDDRELFVRAVVAVVSRAARLSATAIGATLDHIGRLSNVTVAVDGGVFENLGGFPETMQSTLKELYPESSVTLTLTRDGSGIGAAIIASTSY